MTGDRLRLGLIGAGWISSIHLDGARPARADDARRGRLGPSGACGRARPTAGRRRLRRSRADARRAAARRRVHRRPAVRVRRDLRGGRRARDPVPRREAARGDRCRRAGSRGGRDRPTAGSWWPWATTCARSSGCPRSAPGWPPTPPASSRRAGTTARPPPAWWRREPDGGGQVIEQATHLYDLARLLVGEAEVVGAASLHETPADPGRDGRRGCERGGPALLHRRRGDVRQHAPPVDAHRRDLVLIGRTGHDDPEGQPGPDGLGGRAARRHRRGRPPAGPRPVRDPGRDVPRRGGRRRPVGACRRPMRTRCAPTA